MILTKEILEKRLNSPDNLINQIEREQNSPTIVIKDNIRNKVGRPGVKNLSESERVAIGVLAHTVGEDVAAELFDVSKSHAHALKYGSKSLNPDYNNGQAHTKDMALQQKINERLESTKLTIQEKAAETLLNSMGLLNTPDKLENCSAKDLASISNQMSQVVRNMAGQSAEKNSGKSNVKIILHQPKSSREDMFDLVEIGID